MNAVSMDPIPTPIDGRIPTNYGTTDVRPHIPASADLAADYSGLPTIGAVEFDDNDHLGLTTIYIPLDCTATGPDGPKITDFGYVLLVQDTAEDKATPATLFPARNGGQPVPNAKTGTLVATINKTMPRPKLRVTILTKKTVPPPNPIA